MGCAASTEKKNKKKAAEQPVAQPPQPAAQPVAQPQPDAAPAPAPAPVQPAPAPVAQPVLPPQELPREAAHEAVIPYRKAKIAVVYYSTYGHILQLAEIIAQGVKKAGAEVDIFQIPETLSDDILAKMHAPPKSDAHPVLDLGSTLADYDAFLFGIPTRFGIWPSQWKTFLDATGKIWEHGGYHGKMAGTFTSTASQHGGVETTAFNAITFFAHHGIIYVPFGYAKAFPELTNVTELVGGSPYGAGTIAGGDGSRQPSELEKAIATKQGESFAEIVTRHFC